MKSLILVVGLFAGSLAQADATENIFRNNKDYYVWGGLGFFTAGAHYINDGDSEYARGTSLSGIIGVNGDFEYLWDYDLGLVGSIRYYSTSDDIKDGENLTYSVFSVGAQARFHFPHKAWDFYASPGLGFTSATAKYDDEKSEAPLTVSPTFTFGVAFALTDDWAVGVENTRIWGLGETLNGEIVSDYMLKVRTSF